MDSGLDPLFPAPPPRQAEPTDTRQDIRRGEVRDGHRRKGKDGAHPDSGLFEDELPRVSIPALMAFLEDLISQESPEIPVSSPPGPLPGPESGPAAMAARAYRHAGEPRSLASESSPLPVPPSSRPALDAQDVETIRGLLRILRDLSAQGIDALSLEKAPRFLDSLVAAALKACAES